MPATRRIPRIILAGAIATALAACSPASDPVAGATPARAGTPATAPAQPAPPPATIDDVAVASFLASTYGPAAGPTGEWSTTPTDAGFRIEDESDGQVIRTVCEREPVTRDGQPALLLAICGTVQGAGHPASGVNDFFLLRREGDALAAAASAHMLEFGSAGSPGDVDAARLGADLYGFVVESGFYNMGQGVQTRHVVLPEAGGFVDAGWFRERLDNRDWMEGCRERGDCGQAGAYDIEFELDIDDSDAAAAAYPLLVTESGTACGKPADARYRLTLDPATMTYAVPKALQRDGCTTDAG